MDASLGGLLELLDRRLGVDCLWVYGSEASGRARPDSDLDVAVLARERLSAPELADLRGEAEALLGRPVDLVDLDRASPILAYQVLKHGRLLVDRNPSRRYRFTAVLPSRREDVLIMRRPIEKRLIERMMRGPRMVERDVVLAKIARIDRCLGRIEQTRDPARNLDPQDTEDIVELNLLRAVQTAVDLAGHVVATEGLGLPARLADNFTLLERQGLISAELADHLRRMAGFRNIAVHEHTTVDPEVVESIVEHRLGDLRELCRRILSRFGTG